MLIKSLKYKNFRQFKGENTIEFSIDPYKNVTIILGDNTYGKTTLLQMFNWCFYNKALFNDNPDFLLNLELASNMYNGDSPVEVMVEILLSHEGRDYIISRKQEYFKINGKVLHRPSKLKVYYKELDTGKIGYIESDSEMNDVIQLILPEDLSDYFFFDTERVQSVAERKGLSSAVKDLLGLSVLDNAKKHLGKEEAKTTVIGSLYEDLGKIDDGKASDALEKIQEAEETHDYQQKVKEDAEAEIENYERRKKVLEDKIRDLEATTELQKRKDDLVKDINSEKEALEKIYTEYPILFGDDSVWFFAQPLFRQALEFLEKADVDDKGISDVTANTIHELLERGRCLCGAEIKDGNDAYLHLVQLMKYIPPESIGTTIKNFKKDINQFNKVNSNDRYFNSIQNRVAEMLRLKKRIHEWEDAVAKIEEQIAGKEDSKKYQLELNDVNKRIKEKNDVRDKAIGKIQEAISKKERFKKVYDKLISQSDKGKEIKRYLAYAEKVYEWIDQYYRNEEEKIRGELEVHVNDIFQRMYHGERKLEINEKYKTILYSVIPGTNEMVVSGESEGLIRVKNFAFIAGLVDLAKEKALKVGENSLVNEPYPLVLDAPFSNADEEHIKNISMELPKVAEQIIMFVMQKDWRYAEAVMLDRVNKMYTLEKHSDTYSTIQ